jgi:hypothetical protein
MLRLAGRILVFILGVAFDLFVWVFVVALRALLVFLALGLRFAFLTVINLFVGIPEGSDRIATEIVNQAIAEGMPPEHEETIYPLARGAAIGSIIFGWFMLCIYTVAFCAFCSLIMAWIF